MQLPSVIITPIAKHAALTKKEEPTENTALNIEKANIKLGIPTMHIANITTTFNNGAILFFSFLLTLLILALFLPSAICFARLSLSVPALYLRLESFDSSHEPLSSSFWSRLFIFPSSNTYNIIVISAITAATLSVTFGLNVKNILSNINIGTARSADPAKYLPIETGKSADTFPV